MLSNKHFSLSKLAQPIPTPLCRIKSRISNQADVSVFNFLFQDSESKFWKSTRFAGLDLQAVSKSLARCLDEIPVPKPIRSDLQKSISNRPRPKEGSSMKKDIYVCRIVSADFGFGFMPTVLKKTVSCDCVLRLKIDKWGYRPTLYQLCSVYLTKRCESTQNWTHLCVCSHQGNVHIFTQSFLLVSSSVPKISLQMILGQGEALSKVKHYAQNTSRMIFQTTC